MRCGKVKTYFAYIRERSRNPHECAVAKAEHVRGFAFARASQPARMRCGKGTMQKLEFIVVSRNPHECAVAK